MQKRAVIQDIDFAQVILKHEEGVAAAIAGLLNLRQRRGISPEEIGQ
jgi:hypothetical protein